MSHFYGILLMFLAACSYGAAAILIKLGYRAGLHPATLLTLQNVVAIACMLPLLLLTTRVPRLEPGRLRRLVLQGLGGNFAISVCYFWSAQRIDVSLLSIILFTYPGLVLVYQIVAEKHRPSRGEFLALGLSLGGAFLAAEPFRPATAGIDPIGLILAAGAALSYAFMNVHGQKLARGMPPMAITFITSTVSTLAMVAVFPSQYWLTVSFAPYQWACIVGLALLSTVLPMNLMYLALRRIGAFHASVVSIAELPCILVLAFFILHERMSAGQLTGGIMILLSVILMQPAMHAEPEPEPSQAVDPEALPQGAGPIDSNEP